MGKLLDISVPLHGGLPLWPGSRPIHIERVMDLAGGDDANVSELTIDLHSGTHIDAPLHFIQEGATTEEVPLEKMVGNCFIADFRGLHAISGADLENADIPAGVKRLLLKTDNSSRWGDFAQPFRSDFCALTPDAAQWIVRRDLMLIGIDGPSIQLYEDPYDTHIVLLQNQIVILENLNLLEAEPGPAHLICLPLRVRGVEAVPVRAVLSLS